MCNVLTKHRNLSVCLCVWVCVCVCRQPEQQAIKGKWVEPHLSVWRGHSGANCLCIFANTYSFLWVLAFHVFICERLRIFVLFFSLHIHPCHNVCVCVCPGQLWLAEQTSSRIVTFRPIYVHTHAQDTLLPHTSVISVLCHSLMITIYQWQGRCTWKWRWIELAAVAALWWQPVITLSGPLNPPSTRHWT